MRENFRFFEASNSSSETLMKYFKLFHIPRICLLKVSFLILVVAVLVVSFYTERNPLKQHLGQKVGKYRLALQLNRVHRYYRVPDFVHKKILEYSRLSSIRWLR